MFKIDKRRRKIFLILHVFFLQIVIFEQMQKRFIECNNKLFYIKIIKTNDVFLNRIMTK